MAKIGFSSRKTPCRERPIFSGTVRGVYLAATARLYPGMHWCLGQALLHVPAEAVALFLVRLFQDANGAGAVLMRANGEQNVQKAHRHSVGIAEVRFHRRQKTLIGKARDGRDEGI